jgi:hypothetical protein
MTDRYFSYDGETYDTHATPEEARAFCERALDQDRAAARDEGEWPDGVEYIRWGPIAERVVEVSRTVSHDDECDTDGCEGECTDDADAVDYGLRAVDGWVPVAERLPGWADRVLLAFAKKSMRVGCVQVGEVGPVWNVLGCPLPPEAPPTHWHALPPGPGVDRG